MAHLKTPGTDWVNAAFVVHPALPQVLLVKHKALGGWYPVGGHIELDTVDADPDAALARELAEETGLLLGRDAFVHQTSDQLTARHAHRGLPPEANNRARQHYVPWAMETHDFAPLPGHYHLALLYLVYALKAEVVLEAGAHHEIRWFGEGDLADPAHAVLESVRLYAVRAIRHRHAPHGVVTRN